MKVFIILLGFAIHIFPAIAHVPHIEENDYTEEEPFVIKDVEISTALYSYLDSDSDYDVAEFEVNESSVLLKVEVIVPKCSQYANFHPSFAIIGPGLPKASDTLPMAVPKNYGAIVVDTPTGNRESYYEMFGGKEYWSGNTFEDEISGTGPWYLVFWHPEGKIGDYTASIGTAEDFGGIFEMFGSLITTMRIRFDQELHVNCD